LILLFRRLCSANACFVFNAMKFLKNPYIIFPALAGLILTTSIFIYYFSPPPTLDLSDAGNFSNKPLPEAVLIDVNSNRDDYAELKKGKVLAFFLTTDCNACKKDVNLISEFYSEPNPNFRIYGVAVENENKVKAYIEQNNIKFPVVIDKKGELLKNLNIKYFPTKFLIENGTIIKTVIGSSRNKDKFLQDFDLEKIY
jgi:peroxiredoxin